MKDARLAALEGTFRALSDPSRLRILGLLAGGEMCVGDIHECLGMPQPAASRHLAYLRGKKLVKTRKAGLQVHYALASCDDVVVRVLMGVVAHCLGHCEPITRDRDRFDAKTGRRTVSAKSSLECCAESFARSDERRRERRKDRRRRQ